MYGYNTIPTEVPKLHADFLIYIEIQKSQNLKEHEQKLNNLLTLSVFKIYCRNILIKTM